MATDFDNLAPGAYRDFAEAAARKLGLDFIPLFQERFDLVLPREQIADQHLRPLFDILTSLRFRGLIETLGGYHTEHTGDQLTP